MQKVEVIGRSAFKNCISLSDIDAPLLRNLNDGAFENTNLIDSDKIKIPNIPKFINKKNEIIRDNIRNKLSIVPHLSGLYKLYKPDEDIDRSVIHIPEPIDMMLAKFLGYLDGGKKLRKKSIKKKTKTRSRNKRRSKSRRR